MRTAHLFLLCARAQPMVGSSRLKCVALPGKWPDVVDFTSRPCPGPFLSVNHCHLRCSLHAVGAVRLLCIVLAAVYEAGELS